jgi:uncharacterized membrane protein YqjE
MEEESTASFSQLADSSKQFARRLMTTVENRLELLKVELQEERERLLHALLLVLGVVACGFLAGIVFTALVVVLFWNTSPVAVLLVMTLLYGGTAAVLYWRLRLMLRDWQMLTATLDQLRKDRECLEKLLQ